MGIKNENKHLKLNIQLFASDAEVKFKVVLDGNEAEKSVSSLTRTTENLSKKLANTGKTLTASFTLPLVGLGTYAVKTASDLEEVQNVVDTTFDDSSKIINKFAKEAAQKFGLSELSAKQFSGTMGAMLKSMNISEKEITEMSMSLTGLAGDMASFYNLDPSEAFEKLRAGISGETEPLKQLGINMSVVNLEAFAMSKGITKSYDSMTQAEQATLRYQYIMKTTADAQGDYSKTADSTANQTRTLMLEIESLSAEIGQMLIPFANSLLKSIRNIVKSFSNLDTRTKNIILTIGTLIATIGPVILIISKLISTAIKIKEIITIIKSWTLVTKAMAIAQGLLNTAMAMNPITLIVLAIVALIGVLVLLWNKCEWFRNGVMAVINAIWSTIKNVVNIIKNIVMAVLTAVWAYIKTYVNIYITIFKTIFTVIKTILTKVKSIFSTIFKIIATIVKTYINVVLSVFRTIWSVASNIVAKVKNAFVRLGSGIKSVFSSIKNFISNLFGKIAGVVKAPINAVIRGLNKIKLPSWVPGLGGKGINIPLLATGTNYVAGEGLAYLHKGEAVVPKKYNPAVGGYGGSQPVYVNVIADLDVNKFGKAFVRDIKTFSGGAKNDYNYGGM